LDELDLVREAANAAKLRRNFENSELIYIPEIHWPLTRPKVMVMERIHGIPVGEIEQLKAAGANFEVLAERGVEIFFTQVFRDNFFHADMHPGNIFVEVPDKYIAVDFGIVGSLSLSDQRYLAENFLAFFNRDYRKVAQMHVESGWVPSSTRIEEFESAIRSVCEPIFEKPLKDISFGQLLLRLFQTARRFDMHVQPQLVLLQKTLLNIEGLGRQLYPELDLWQTAKPFLEKWFHDRIGPKAKITKLIKQFPEFAEQFPEIPSLIYKALDNAAHAQQQAEAQQRELAMLRQQMDNNHRTTVWAMIISSVVISLAVLLQ
jgi:ubiquinone biosynthesis protein